MKAFFSAFVETLRKARRSSEQQNRTQVRKPNVAYWHLADIKGETKDVGFWLESGRAVSANISGCK